MLPSLALTRKNCRRRRLSTPGPPQQFVSALRHDQSNPEFNADLRQLLHVGFKVAAKLGGRYLRLLEEFEPTIAKNVTGNLYERHIKPVFVE